MTRLPHVRQQAAGAVLVALITSMLALVGVSSAAADDGDDSFARIAECIAEQQHLLLLAVVDESASLRRTDPEGVRASAVTTLVRNIVRLGETGGDDLTVELALAAFATDLTLVTDWTAASGGSRDGLVSAARSFAQREAGIDTDFAESFIGAADVLDARARTVASEQNVDPCRVVVTFTDGEYDLEPRDRSTSYAPDVSLSDPGATDEVAEIGRGLLCRDDGVIDRLHDDGTVLLTVGLGDIAVADQQFLEAASTGRGCGSVSEPGLGAFVSAADLVGLVFAFDVASSGIAGGSSLDEESVVPCDRESCASGTTTFVLDETLSTFHLLVSAPEPLRVVLSGPDGDERDLADLGQETVVSGARLTRTQLDAVAVVDGGLALPATWAGEWAVTFIDPTGENGDLLGRTQATLFGALRPVIAAPEQARVGQPLEVRVDVVGEDGGPRTPDGFLDPSVLQLVASDPVSGATFDVEPGVPVDSSWPFVVDIPQDLESTSLELRSQLQVTTSGGVRLPEARDGMSVALLPPAGYPTVEPVELDFGAVEGAAVATAALTLIGGEDPGCVEVLGGTLTAAPDVGVVDLRVEGADGCLAVAPGERRAVSLELSRDGSASGDATGELAVVLHSDVAPDNGLQRQIPVRAGFLRVVDAQKRWRLVAALFAAALLVPWALVRTLNWWVARFRAPGRTRVLRATVRVAPNGSVRRLVDGEDRQLSFDERDASHLTAPVEDARSFASHGLRFDVLLPVMPFGTPTGYALGEGYCTGRAGHLMRDGLPAARCPFELHGHWIASVRSRDEDGSWVVDLLVMLREEVTVTRVAERLAGDVAEQLGSVLHALPPPPEPVEPPDDERGPASVAAETPPSSPWADAPWTDGDDDIDQPPGRGGWTPPTYD